MLAPTVHVKILSRDSGFSEAIARVLGEGFTTEVEPGFLPAGSGEIQNQEWRGVVLLDLRSADEAVGLRLLDEAKRIPSHPPVVVLCPEENRDLMLRSIRRGAYDGVSSPPNIAELRLVLNRAHKCQEAEEELQRLRANDQSAGCLHELLGTSAPMQDLFRLARKIAPCHVNVLITGETGSGKELLARAIHHLGGRNGGPLVAFSCANLPETLIEDELFGHEKGAFTGAMVSRRGRFESADQGTLFLDEIGDLGLGLQPKLLRVIQERSFERLGSNKTIHIDTRLICATNRDLAEMVQQGKFREDLYYRLNVVQLHLPPLRERRDDIPLLAQRFLLKFAEQFHKQAKRFSRQALQALEQHNWPGNVRELENVVQRAVVLCEDQAVDIRDLPAALRAGGGDADEKASGEGPAFSHSYEEEVRWFKRRLVLRTLRECGWSKTEAARSLGVARGYLHRLIHHLEIVEGEGESIADQRGHLPPPRPVM